LGASTKLLTITSTAVFEGSIMSVFEWTRSDRIEAEAFRVTRLRRCFTELLSPCFLHLDQNSTLNIHVSTPDAIDDLIDNLAELACRIWLITGAIAVSLWFCQEEILTLPTQPMSEVEWKLLNSIQSAEDIENEENSEMTSATLSKSPTQNSTLTSNNQIKSRPQLKKLETVAALMQISIATAESVCDQEGIELQLDEDGNPVIRLDDAAEMLKAAAISKLSAPREALERNGNGTVVEPILEATAELATPSRQPKIAELPEGFKISLSDPKKTATNALAAFARTQKRQRQIASAIANQTSDGMKYMRSLEALYPADRWEKAKEQLKVQFKKLAAALSEEVQAAS
jgi:hypothetical protein